MSVRFAARFGSLWRYRDVRARTGCVRGIPCASYPHPSRSYRGTTSTLVSNDRHDGVHHRLFRRRARRRRPQDLPQRQRARFRRGAQARDEGPLRGSRRGRGASPKPLPPRKPRVHGPASARTGTAIARRNPRPPSGSRETPARDPRGRDARPGASSRASREFGCATMRHKIASSTSRPADPPRPSPPRTDRDRPRSASPRTIRCVPRDSPLRPSDAPLPPSPPDPTLRPRSRPLTTEPPARPRG